ncbi:putative sugar transport protein 5-like [Sesbania bispinosa]|nr:putative sugar transport protein 5-like [Sesbania bispinosa]
MEFDSLTLFRSSLHECGWSASLKLHSMTNYWGPKNEILCKEKINLIGTNLFRIE